MSRVWEPVSDIAKQVKERTTTAVLQTQKALDIIKKENPDIFAVITAIEERALKRAAEIDKKISEGEDVGRLAGVPFIAKDNMLAFGAETTAASNMLKGFQAPYQATVIERLESEGAICVAKANLDAFAHGASTENSDFGVTKNPHDHTRVAGGSSGGSAAAIAAEFAPFALGTDTGGSIRQPASYCGVIGYKPTYGLNSRSGVVAMASSTDTIGVLAHSVEDTALVTEVMAGKDTLDGTTIDRDTVSYCDYEANTNGLKVGVIKEYVSGDIDSQVAAIVQQHINGLKSLGVQVEEVSIPSVELALAVYYVVVPAEVSSNLARHDGQRYQFSAQGTKNLQESYERSRTQGFGDEAKRRIMMGAHVLSSGYYDAYYNKAQQVRTKLINEFEKVFKQYDFLVGPVAPTPAFKIGENSSPVEMYLQDVLTVSANLVGIPAMSLPVGQTAENLPVGLQIMADRGKDRQLFGFSEAIMESLK